MIAAEDQERSIEELRQLGYSVEQIAAYLAQTTGLSESGCRAGVAAIVGELERKPGDDLIEV